MALSPLIEKECLWYNRLFCIHVCAFELLAGIGEFWRVCRQFDVQQVATSVVWRMRNPAARLEVRGAIERSWGCWANSVWSMSNPLHYVQQLFQPLPVQQIKLSFTGPLTSPVQQVLPLCPIVRKVLIMHLLRLGKCACRFGLHVQLWHSIPAVALTLVTVLMASQALLRTNQVGPEPVRGRSGGACRSLLLSDIKCW